MNRINKMNCWTLFFSGLSAIATLGLLICTIIGFWFIYKQIRIDKNKDIFFSLQKSLETLLNIHDKNAFMFSKEIDLLERKFIKIIDDDTVNYKQSFKDEKAFSSEFKTMLINYGYKCNYDIISLHDWWLSENEREKLTEMLENLKKTDFVATLYLNKFLENECTKDNKLIPQLVSDNLWLKYKLRISAIEKAKEDINSFLEKLAENKGIL